MEHRCMKSCLLEDKCQFSSQCNVSFLFFQGVLGNNFADNLPQGRLKAHALLYLYKKIFTPCLYWRRNASSMLSEQQQLLRCSVCVYTGCFQTQYWIVGHPCFKALKHLFLALRAQYTFTVVTHVKCRKIDLECKNTLWVTLRGTEWEWNAECV